MGNKILKDILRGDGWGLISKLNISYGTLCKNHWNTRPGGRTNGRFSPSIRDGAFGPLNHLGKLAVLALMPFP